MATRAPFRVEVDMTGWEPLIQRLRDIQRKAQQKPVRKALGKAAFVVRKAARKNALGLDDPTTGRQIAYNVRQRVRSGVTRATGNPTVSVGVVALHGRIPRGNPDTGPRGNTPHWHLLELGTAKSRAVPFLRPALTANVNAAIAEFAREFRKQLEREGV